MGSREGTGVRIAMYGCFCCKSRIPQASKSKSHVREENAGVKNNWASKYFPHQGEVCRGCSGGMKRLRQSVRRLQGLVIVSFLSRVCLLISSFAFPSPVLSSKHGKAGSSRTHGCRLFQRSMFVSTSAIFSPYTIFSSSFLLLGC